MHSRVQNSILGNVLEQGTKALEQAHTLEPHKMLLTLCSNEHTSQSTYVCFFLVALFEQPTSHTLPCSGRRSSPFVEPFIALVEASLFFLLHPTCSMFKTLNALNFLALSLLLKT